MPPTGCEDMAMIPSVELLDMVKPLRASFATTSPATDRIDHDEDILGNEDTAGMVPTVRSRMGKQLDVRIWEVIQKEIMDCHEPSQLHGLQGCSNVSSCLAYYDPTMLC